MNRRGNFVLGCVTLIAAPFVLLIAIAAVFSYNAEPPADPKPAWPHRVTAQATNAGKFSATVRVAVVDGLVPSGDELEAIAAELRKQNKNTKTYFVEFLLPGMIDGAGAWATCHSTQGNAIAYPFAGTTSRLTGFPAELDPIFESTDPSDVPRLVDDQGQPLNREI